MTEIVADYEVLESTPHTPQTAEPSYKLIKALNIINYSDKACRIPRPPEGRRGKAQKVAYELLKEDTAEELYTELLTFRNGYLFKDEADLLEFVAERLGKPLQWRNKVLWDGESWGGGRKTLCNN